MPIKVGNVSLVFKLAREGDLDQLSKLIADDPSLVSEKSSTGWPPILFAIEGGHFEIVRWLMEGFKEEALKKEDCSKALFVAAACGHIDIVDWIIECLEQRFNFDKDLGNQALIGAASRGRLNVVAQLINTGKADVNGKDYSGRTALIVAAEWNRLNVIEWLIRQGGASVDDKDIGGRTALMMAAASGNLDSVQWLIEKGGATINEQDNSGYTALIWAVRKSYIEIMQCLIEHGAEVDKKEKEGYTALMIAIIWNRLYAVQYLIEQGKANIDEKNNKGQTALMLATAVHRLEIAEYLREVNNITPFLCAVKKSQVEVVISSKRTEVSYIELRWAWNLVLKQAEPNLVIKEILQKEIEYSNKIIENLDLPPELFCPICLELMLDPVLGSDTYTYEREAIEKTLSINMRSPMTRVLMYKDDLCSNHFVSNAVKKIIEQIDLVRQGQEGQANNLGIL